MFYILVNNNVLFVSFSVLLLMDSCATDFQQWNWCISLLLCLIIFFIYYLIFNIYLIIWSVPSLIYFYGVHLHDRKTLPYFCCSTEENITQLKHKILKSFPTLRCSNFETSINFPNSFTFTFLWLVFITHVFEYS